MTDWVTKRNNGGSRMHNQNVVLRVLVLSGCFVSCAAFCTVGVTADFDYRKADISASDFRNVALNSDSVVPIENSPVWIRVGLGKNSNFIEVWCKNDLLWVEGFHRNTHNLSTNDVTGWAPPDKTYGVLFAVRYGRNRDLFQFWQIKIADDETGERGAGLMDRFYDDDHIKLDWGFGSKKEYVVRTYPYGNAKRYAYDFDPDKEVWKGFSLGK